MLTSIQIKFLTKRSTYYFIISLCKSHIIVQIEKYGDRVKKVVIIDYDYHHGDGTQGIFYRIGNVLYISIHR